MDKDENAPILGIQSALVPQKKGKIELENTQRRIKNDLYISKMDGLKILYLEKIKEYYDFPYFFKGQDVKSAHWNKKHI